MIQNYFFALGINQVIQLSWIDKEQKKFLIKHNWQNSIFPIFDLYTIHFSHFYILDCLFILLTVF